MGCQTATYLPIDFQAPTCHQVTRLQLLRPQQIPNVLCGVSIDRAPPFGTGPQAEALSSLERVVANSAHLPPPASSDKNLLSPPQHPFVPLLSSINSSLQQPPFRLRPPGRPPTNPSSHFSEAGPPSYSAKNGCSTRALLPWCCVHGRDGAGPFHQAGGAPPRRVRLWCCEFLLLFFISVAIRS